MSWLACSSGGGPPRDAAAPADTTTRDTTGPQAPDGPGEGGASDPSGTLTVNTTCGLVLTPDCPTDHASDGRCGLEEALLAVEHRRSENGCAWSGTMGLNDTILIPAAGTFRVTTSMDVSRALTIRSSVSGTFATIETSAAQNLFGVAPDLPVSVTFEDLHLIGPGQWIDVQATGLAISGESPDPGPTINVRRCWIEQFSDGAIVASDVTLNILDSTLDSNSNDFGDGGGAIFYGTNGDARSQVSSMTIKSSSITRNHSTKGGGMQIQSNSITRIVNSTISWNLTDGGHGGGISFANNAGPLADGILSILGSTIAFNGSTGFAGGGIAVGANRDLFSENINNRIHLAGSIVANNCIARVNPDRSFTCYTPDDISGDIDLMRDSLIGTSQSATIIGPAEGGQGRLGVTLLDVEAGLDPELTDQGGEGQRHPRVHRLQSDSLAVDVTDSFQPIDGADQDPGYLMDQTHQRRGFDHPPAGPKVFDLGAVERRSEP